MQVRIGLPAIVPGGNPEAFGSRAGRKEKSCADEDNAHGGQSGERVSDVCDKDGFPSAFWHPESAAPDPVLRPPGQQPHLPQPPGPVQADPPQLLSGAQQRSLVTGSRDRDHPHMIGQVEGRGVYP